MKTNLLLAVSLAGCVDPADPQTATEASDLTLPVQQAVLVINDAARPIPVVMPPAPHREPFQYSGMEFVLTAQGQLEYGANSYAAPAGKRIVLERVSLSCDTPQGSRPSLWVKVVPATSTRQFAKVYLAPPVPLDAGTTWIYNQDVKLVADDGDTITFSRMPSATPTNTGCTATLIGETVDL